MKELVGEVAKDIIAVWMHPEDDRYEEILGAIKVRLTLFAKEVKAG